MDMFRVLSDHVKSTYDMIKVITYVRTKKPSPDEFSKVLPTRIWDSETYLKPLDPEDTWLWTDLEFLCKYIIIQIIVGSNMLKGNSLEGLEMLQEFCVYSYSQFSFTGDEDDMEPKYVNSENGVITLSKEHFDQLQVRT